MIVYAQTGICMQEYMDLHLELTLSNKEEMLKPILWLFLKETDNLAPSLNLL